MKFADYPDHVAQELADERDDFIVMISEPPMDEVPWTEEDARLEALATQGPPEDDYPEGWEQVEPDWDALNDDRRLADEGAFL